MVYLPKYREKGDNNRKYKTFLTLTLSVNDGRSLVLRWKHNYLSFNSPFSTKVLKGKVVKTMLAHISSISIWYKLVFPQFRWNLDAIQIIFNANQVKMEDPIPEKFQYGASFYIAIITLMGTILNVKALFILLETTKVTIIHKFAILDSA